MKTLIIYLAKKYLVAAVNDTLKKYSDDVFKITNVITLWVDRLEKIITQLKNINARIGDAKLDDDEIKQSVEEIETLIKEF